MKKNLNVYISILWVIIGAILIGLSFVEKLDEFWSGMGSALLVVGGLRLLRIYRFNKNEAFREQAEIEQKDERNHYIRNKAWAWAGYVYVIVGAVLTIVFKIINLEVYSMVISATVCVVLVLFWLYYHILRRKY